jgi:DMSO/TMAO reductase YedYZ molybdopterin-dependent catalytic subunit
MTEQQPRLTRRDLFRLGLVAGPAALVAACGWDGGPVLEPKLRAFSRLNDWIGEKILLSPSRYARQYPVSARTPMEQFPAYSITYNQTGSFPSLSDTSKWMLDVGGMVRKPMRLSLRQIEALPSLTYTVKHHCVEGWTAVATWTGVAVNTIAAMVEPTGQAR